MAEIWFVVGEITLDAMMAQHATANFPAQHFESQVEKEPSAAVLPIQTNAILSMLMTKRTTCANGSTGSAPTFCSAGSPMLAISLG